jgi:hypothetical protein
VAFRRSRGRPDPHEYAAERLGAGIGPFEPLPEELRRSHRRRIILYVVIGLVVVAVLRDGLGRGAPPVHGSCTKPAFAFDRDEVRQDGVVKWSVAGASGSYVIITADSASAASGRLLGPLPLKHCGASGRFGVPLREGDHVLRVFLRSPSGATSLVGSQKVVVSTVG